MSSFEKDNAQLLRSISQADKKTLEDALLTMCKSSAECLQQAKKQLLVPEDVADPGDSSEDDTSDETDNIAPHGQKRLKRSYEGNPLLVARYRTCRNCKKEFDVTLNHYKACYTHTGERELDVEYFPDDDDIAYGDGAQYIDPDTDWRAEEFPEGFPWSCCNKPADDAGCVVDKHRS